MKVVRCLVVFRRACSHVCALLLPVALLLLVGIGIGNVRSVYSGNGFWSFHFVRELCSLVIGRTGGRLAETDRGVGRVSDAAAL